MAIISLIFFAAGFSIFTAPLILMICDYHNGDISLPSPKHTCIIMVVLLLLSALSFVGLLAVLVDYFLTQLNSMPFATID